MQNHTKAPTWEYLVTLLKDNLSFHCMQPSQNFILVSYLMIIATILVAAFKPYMYKNKIADIILAYI